MLLVLVPPMPGAHQPVDVCWGSQVAALVCVGGRPLAIGKKPSLFPRLPWLCSASWRLFCNPLLS